MCGSKSQPHSARGTVYRGRQVSAVDREAHTGRSSRISLRSDHWT